MVSLTLGSHMLLSVVYTYSIYVYVYCINPPEEILAIRNGNYGPFKYLTFWDLLLQWLWFTLAAGHGLASGGSHRHRNKPFMQRTLDYIFTTLVFPLAMFVVSTFWLLFMYNRDMIFPEIFDTFFPAWLNHCVHSLPAVTAILQLMCCQQTFPSQRRGFLTIAAAALAYLLWVCYIAHTTGHWVYPVLAHLRGVGRMAFIAAMCIFVGIFYFLGYALQAVRWGHAAPQQDLVYHKVK